MARYVSEILRESRNKLDLSQSEVAQRVVFENGEKAARTTIASYENESSAKFPSAERLSFYLKAYELDFHEYIAAYSKDQSLLAQNRAKNKLEKFMKKYAVANRLSMENI